MIARRLSTASECLVLEGVVARKVTDFVAFDFDIMDECATC